MRRQNQRSKKLLELEFWPEIKTVGSDIKIITDDTPAFRRTLTLKNTDAVPMGKEGCYCQNLGMVFKKEQNQFCFYGELEDPVEELAIPFALTFENAEVEIEVYNSCNNMTFWENPWDFLRTISFAIAMKADLPGDYCNAKEKELLPIKEFSMKLAVSVAASAVTGADWNTLIQQLESFIENIHI